jgi:hypothetical protein
MQATAILTKKGEMVYSPIVECHEMARLHEIPTDAEYWKRRNFLMIDAFKKVWVLCLPGWVESVGVQMEINYAIEKEYQIRYFMLTQTDTTPREHDVVELESSKRHVIRDELLRGATS